MATGTARYEEYYYPNVCHVCKRRTRGRELIDCEECFAFRYCCVEHRLVHRPAHAQLCRALKLLPIQARTRGILKKLIELAVCRPLTPAESQLWMFPRMCAVCSNLDRNLLRDCTECPAISYCSDACEEADINHKIVCKKLKTQSTHYLHMLNGIPNECMAIDINVPVKRLQTEIFKVNELSPPISAVFLSDKLSHVFTLYHILEMFNKLTSKSLTLHIVGAIHEYYQFDRQICELLFHWLPSLKTIDIVFVGPEVVLYEGDGWAFCSSCSEKKATVRYKYKVTLYSKYCTSVDYERPDVIAVFNCGFHEHTKTEKDLWAASFPSMLLPKVPLLMTSYNKEEAILDFQCLKPSIGNKVVNTIAYQPNNFRSLLPLRDWTNPNEFYYKNNYYSVIRVC